MEGPIIEIEKSVEKRTLRALIAHKKKIVRETGRKHVSNGIMQKRLDMAEVRGKQDTTKFEAKEKSKEANKNWKEHVKK